MRDVAAGRRQPQVEEQAAPALDRLSMQRVEVSIDHVVPRHDELLLADLLELVAQTVK